MISFLDGKLCYKSENSIVVEVGGVGFEVMVPVPVLERAPSPGEGIRLYSHMYVRDDSLQLYGFSSAKERDLFLELIGVTGIGPKVALSILSVYSPGEFARAVEEGDVDALMIIPGIGRKSAGRLLLEMREKLDLGMEEELGGIPEEAREASKEARAALVNLGYSKAEARKAVKDYGYGDSDSVEDILRHALKMLAGGKGGGD